MSVFPDNVGGLGSLSAQHIGSEEFDWAFFWVEVVSNLVSFLVLESQKCDNRSGQIIIFVILELTNLCLIFSHFIELEVLNSGSTESQKLDQLSIVEGKLDDGDFK